VQTALGPKASVKVAPGAEVAWDWMKCDGNVMGWVRVVQVTTSAAGMAGARRKADGSLCVPTWGLLVGVGAVRCVDGVKDNGKSPTPEQQTADALNCLEDMAALSRVVLDEMFPANVPTWQALGPQGNLAGGEWTFLVAVDDPL
jgi:hypothetical protein